MQSFQVPEYSLRVYAPDGHSQVFHVTMTTRTAEDIRHILLKESESWNSRVAPKEEDRTAPAQKP